MDVGVIGKLPAPGMEHAEKARDVATNESFVCNERFDCGGRGFEQGLVADVLVASDEGSQGFGHGEGDHEVVGGELIFEFLSQPLPGLVTLAGGAMAIPAGAEDGVVFTTFSAGIDDHPVLG